MNEPRETYSVWFLTCAGRRLYYSTYRRLANATARAKLIQEQKHSSQVVANHPVGDWPGAEHAVVGTYNAPGMPAFEAEEVKK